MKRLMSTLACAAVALSVCFGASAKASVPVSMAPSTSTANYLNVVNSRVIVVEYVFVYEIADLPWEGQTLEAVNQAAEFDRTA